MRCVPAILTTLDRRMGRALSGDDLVELAQDCLALIWRRLATFEGRATLETWAHRFCFLQYMNRLRRRRPQRPLEGDAAEPASRAPVPGDFEFLELALRELGPPEADIVRLKHYDELTFTQIGHRLDVSPSTAKTRYYRGLRWLRRRLAGLADRAM